MLSSNRYILSIVKFLFLLVLSSACNGNNSKAIIEIDGERYQSRNFDNGYEHEPMWYIEYTPNIISLPLRKAKSNNLYYLNIFIDEMALLEKSYESSDYKMQNNEIVRKVNAEFFQPHPRRIYKTKDDFKLTITSLETIPYQLSGYFSGTLVLDSRTVEFEEVKVKGEFNNVFFINNYTGTCIHYY